MAQPEREYDVFISHASEDRSEAVRLAQQLERLGLRVWHDAGEITVGDSLRKVIDRGLLSSRFGVVILSRSFFRKKWTQYELDGLLAKSDGSTKTILPVWHKVSKDEVVGFSPGLGGLAAVSTARGMREVARQIARAVLRESPLVPFPPPPRRWLGAAKLRRLAAVGTAASTITVLAAWRPYLWPALTARGETQGSSIVVTKALELPVQSQPQPDSISAPMAGIKAAESLPFSTRSVLSAPPPVRLPDYREVHRQMETLKELERIRQTARSLQAFDEARLSASWSPGSTDPLSQMRAQERQRRSLQGFDEIRPSVGWSPTDLWSPTRTQQEMERFSRQVLPDPRL